MQETQVQFLGPEDLLEKEMATHSSILTCKIPWTEHRGAWRATVHGVSRVGHDLATKPPPLVDQWLRLHAPSAGDLEFDPWSGNKITHATSETWRTTTTPQKGSPETG